MEQERYIDHLSDNLMQIQEIIENIKGSGLSEDIKTKAIYDMSEKYNKLLVVFKKEVLSYCS
tara:strand:- start:56 stop:241 length:186 start_codon:yes stop_codon:yes gene_type:complete